MRAHYLLSITDSTPVSHCGGLGGSTITSTSRCALQIHLSCAGPSTHRARETDARYTAHAAATRLVLRQASRELNPLKARWHAVLPRGNTRPCGGRAVGVDVGLLVPGYRPVVSSRPCQLPWCASISMLFTHHRTARRLRPIWVSAWCYAGVIVRLMPVLRGAQSVAGGWQACGRGVGGTCGWEDGSREGEAPHKDRVCEIEA